MKTAPIIVFVYNRPKHALETLEALANNTLAKHSRLYIFSDAAKFEEDGQKIEDVRKLIRSETVQRHFAAVEIFCSSTNKGLKQSIIEGVSQVFKKHDSVIVLEDDLVTSSDFLTYMNTLLNKYAGHEKIGSITGYNPIPELPRDYCYDVYFSNRSSSLGWATWKGIWEQIDWKGSGYCKFKKNYRQRTLFNLAGYDRAKRLDLQMKKDAKSWSILFGFDLFLKNRLIVYPKNSKLINIGWDGTGTHNASFDTSKFNNNLPVQDYPLVFPKKVSLSTPLVKLQQHTFGNSMQLKLKDLLVFIKNYIT